MHERRRLSDILPAADRDAIAKAWETTTAADDLGPLPAGEYHCRILDGSAFSAKSGTTGFKLTFEVIDGDHVGRRAWHDIWLTPAAIGMAKRDLAKLGVMTLAQLDRPLPSGMLATVKLVLRKDDDGTERNRVSRFDVTGIEQPEPEPFAPIADVADADGFDWTTGQQTGGKPA